MRIGVKYCGGCNPRYDRTALVARLKQKRPDDWVEPASPGVCYDEFWVVCGCPVQCADLEGLEGRTVLRLWELCCDSAKCCEN